MINIDLDISKSICNDFFNKSKNILNSISSIIQSKTQSPSSFAIDRFEGKFAICENLKTNEIINVPIAKLPKDLKENDIITLKNNNFYFDRKKTEIRKEKIQNLTKDIMKKIK